MLRHPAFYERVKFMHIDFSEGSGWETGLMTAYTFRFAETPAFTQEQDHIRTAENPAHPEGYDNISLLSKETYTVGAKIAMRSSFKGMGCPQIILVENVEQCPDGAMRYGACFEVSLYENGFNVWRHYRENGECTWHQRLGVEYPVAENVVHELTVCVQPDMLEITLNGQRTLLRTEDLPERFHLGITACEGIARVYELLIEK